MNKKGIGSLNHAAKHLPDFVANAYQFIVLAGGDVSTVPSKIQGRVSFAVFTIAVGQLAYKMRPYRRFAQASRKFKTY